MVAEIAQAYAERSGADIAGQSSVSQLEIADGTVPVDNEGNASEPVIELSVFRTVIRSVRASAAAGISARPLRANRTNRLSGETTPAARGRCAMYR